SIYDISFVGGADAKIAGKLLVPGETNGAGIVVVNDIGGPIDVLGAKTFAERGYVCLASAHRGSDGSEGYVDVDYWPKDIVKQVTILENLTSIDAGLPKVEKVGVYGHCVAGDTVIEAIVQDPRIDAAAVSAFSQDMWHVALTTVLGQLPRTPESVMKFLNDLFIGLKVESVGKLFNPLIQLVGIVLPASIGDILASMLEAIPSGLVSMLNTALCLPRIAGIMPSGQLRALFELIVYVLAAATHSGYNYAPEIGIPIIYIHGTNDYASPVDWSKKVYELTASQNKDLVLIQNADHWYMTPEGISVAPEALGYVADWFDVYLPEEI
ncbi:MAG TPA: alpha/beta hydrolase, partial [Methanocellales archaeon]|nr:alpha/beta hydrolase [Methanocellales archaeon]